MKCQIHFFSSYTQGAGDAGPRVTRTFLTAKISKLQEATRIPPYTVRIPSVYHARIPAVYHRYTVRIPAVYHPYTMPGSQPYTTVYRPYTSRIPSVYHRIPSVYQPYTIRIPPWPPSTTPPPPTLPLSSKFPGVIFQFSIELFSGTQAGTD